MLFPKIAAEARELQREMASQVILKDQFQKPIKFIAGVDVSNNRFDPKKMLYASVVILEYPTLKLIETVSIAEKATFPYITGLLGFREAPVVIKAFEKLTIKPDVLFVDGHGVSHPRGLGIATHLGLLLNLPSVGVAKSILVGKPDGSLQQLAGSQVSLKWKDQTIGTLLRTKKNCLPLIVSAGHKITLSTSVELVCSCLKGYRLTEPTRLAHLAANACRRFYDISHFSHD